MTTCLSVFKHLDRRTPLVFGALVLAAVLGLPGSPAHAQSTDQWPAKSLRVIVPYTPGGATDTVARTVMDKLGQRVKQTIVVENRPGANGTVGTAAGARSEPDGYAFVMVLAAHTANPSLYQNLPYKPSDLVPVSHIADLPCFSSSTTTFPPTLFKSSLPMPRKMRANSTLPPASPVPAPT